MGTSGMTSQAFGQRNLEEVTKLLLRSVGVGLFIALCLMTLQYPIQKAAFAFIQTSDEVERLATLYFRICIWGAPAMLGLYGFAGWFIGMQNSRFPMYIAITQNIVNILASLCFVFLFGMKVEGVALGTLIAQYAGFLMALLLWLRYYKQLRKRVHWRGIWQKTSHVSVLSGKSRYFSPYFVPGSCNDVLHLCRSRPRRSSTGCKHFINAAVYPLFIYYGWICLCRRGTCRSLYWRR